MVISIGTIVDCLNKAYDFVDLMVKRKERAAELRVSLDQLRAVFDHPNCPSAESTLEQVKSLVRAHQKLSQSIFIKDEEMAVLRMQTVTFVSTLNAQALGRFPSFDELMTCPICLACVS